MKASDLCVVCKPSGPTDTPAGGLPWQSYVYALDHYGKAYTCNLTGALLTDSQGAFQCLANVQVHRAGFRIVSLADAILQDRTAAVEMATRPLAAGLAAYLQRLPEDEYEGPRRRVYLALQVAINDLYGKPLDGRPWTAEEILQREG
jgi:hypothetical protein